ncbi:hypothetical protein [Ensifer aridi]|uniref:hypothetical protein n=1 Tax=Ensifer aridi TaxID=1708715 RepID=UPI00111C5B38|nr:hypothetical protein [Ensifer aridi]
MSTSNERTTIRERKHRKLMKRAGQARTFNPHDYEHRYELMADCAFRAVQSVFGHLAVDDIRKPPRALKDAQLARQIAIRIMADDFGMEQRYICRMQGRQRTSIHFAIQTVEKRMECEVFSAAYEGMVAEAFASYDLRMQQGA